MTATLIPPLKETKPFTTRTMRATVSMARATSAWKTLRGLTPGRARR